MRDSEVFEVVILSSESESEGSSMKPNWDSLVSKVSASMADESLSSSDEDGDEGERGGLLCIQKMFVMRKGKLSDLQLHYWLS